MPESGLWWAEKVKATVWGATPFAVRTKTRRKVNRFERCKRALPGFRRGPAILEKQRREFGRERWSGLNGGCHGSKVGGAQDSYDEAPLDPVGGQGRRLCDGQTGFQSRDRAERGRRRRGRLGGNGRQDRQETWLRGISRLPAERRGLR